MLRRAFIPAIVLAAVGPGALLHDNRIETVEPISPQDALKEMREIVQEYMRARYTINGLEDAENFPVYDNPEGLMPGDLDHLKTHIIQISNFIGYNEVVIRKKIEFSDMPEPDVANAANRRLELAEAYNDTQKLSGRVDLLIRRVNKSSTLDASHAAPTQP